MGNDFKANEGHVMLESALICLSLDLGTKEK
jgi:hypothetical protein